MATEKPAGITVTALHPDDTPVTNAGPLRHGRRRCRTGVAGGAGHLWRGKGKGGLDLRSGGGDNPARRVERLGSRREMVHRAQSDPATGADTAAPRYIRSGPRCRTPPACPSASSWAPTGAWGYRVFEATEAAILLAACGQPGPVLTKGFARPDADAVRSPHGPGTCGVKAAYRKLGTRPSSRPCTRRSMRYEALLPRGSA